MAYQKNNEVNNFYISQSRPTNNERKLNEMENLENKTYDELMETWASAIADILFDAICAPENWYTVRVFENENDHYPMMRYFANYDSARYFANSNARTIREDCGNKETQN